MTTTSTADPRPTLAAPEIAADPAWSPYRWLALAVAVTAGFMDLLDTTIVNVAIPSIRSDLSATYASIEWVISGYLLTFAVLLITGGRLGDLFGRRRVFIAGVAGFGLTSLVSGLAPSIETLIAARLLQGVAAAIMIPQILAMVQVNFPRDEQQKAVAIYSALAGVATMSGPMLAGVLLRFDPLDLGWRAIFLLNVPISVGVIVGALRWMPESRSAESRRLDLVGVALLSVALFSLVFALIEGRQEHWPAWSFAMLAVFPPMLAAFARYERRLEERGGAPLVPMRLFRDRTFAVGTLIGLVFFSGLVGFFLVFTIFLQLGLGFTPLQSALTTFPSSVGLILSAVVSQRFAAKLGRRMLHLGVALMALAMVAIVVSINHCGAALVAWNVRPVILFFGIGMGMTLPQLADFVLSNVDASDAGAGSGVLNSGLQVGNVLGIAITGVLMFSALSAQAPQSAAAGAQKLDRTLASQGVPPAARAAATNQFERCFVARAKDDDPTANPPRCRATANAPVPDTIRAAMNEAGSVARAENFVAAIQPALWFVVGVLVCTFGLMFLLPLTPRRDDLVAPR
jgi:EmrB/QacA subfamily drug resistance transporter